MSDKKAKVKRTLIECNIFLCEGNEMTVEQKADFLAVDEAVMGLIHLAQFMGKIADELEEPFIKEHNSPAKKD